MDLNRLVSKNQSIKIVPSIEDSLRSIGLNVDLDENAKLWFEQLKTTWSTWRKSATIESHFEMFFDSVIDPHRTALVFTIKCEEYKDCKPKTLPYFIIETLLKWSQKKAIVPEESLKLPAFKIAIQQRNQHFLNLTVKTFHVSTIKELILPIVRDMITNDNCRQASQIVIATELYDDIPVESLLFPLILQDKTNMIDEYLSVSPSQVKPFVLFLDGLLDKKISIREHVQKYIEENKVCHIKYDKLHYKPFGKLVARLCNKFNIPIETCKNLSKNRTIGGLRYLIHQKYQEHNVSSAVWDDLVKDSLQQSAGSAIEFIDMLVEYDRKEALKWAEYLNLPDADLPLALREMSIEENVKEENWDTELKTQQEYYKSSLIEEQITVIDTAEKFYDLMASHLVNSSVVSIDCEWKPSFGATQSQVALIQIASNNCVYLIDTIILNKQQYSSFWHTFYKSLLDNAEIIKLGFGLEQDLKEIKASVTGLGSIKVKGEGLLDLCLLWRNLLDSGLMLPSNSDIGGNSLSSLVQSCFGLPLQKSEQCSNWELRPLRSTQIQYAALDAYILLEIYLFLQKLCLEQGINFEEICNDVMVEGKKKCANKKSNKTHERPQTLDSNIQSNSVQEVKLLVEPILSNLMSFLRYCGIDTTASSNTMLWYDVINLAISEDRYVILKKLKYSPSSNFPQKFILDVGKSSSKEQLQKIMCYFNINVKQNDLLSRCIMCNSTDLKKLEPKEVSNICMDYQSAINVKTIDQRFASDYEDDEVDFNNFLCDSDCDEDLRQPVQNVHQNKNCKTSKGVTIDIDGAHKLSTLDKPAILCETCGRLFWEEDEELKPVVELIFNLTKLRIW